VGFRSINTVVIVTTLDANLLALCVIIAGENGFGLRVSAPSDYPAPIPGV
jgi:hypothetical protein